MLTSLPYLFVLVRLIIRAVFLTDDVDFLCILLLKWVGPIFLGVEMHQVLQVYDVSLLVIFICVQIGSILVYMDL